MTYAAIIAAATLWIIGIHAITREGMLLSFLSVERWWSKPLTDCPLCMSSAHGAAWFLLVGVMVFGLPWWATPIFCVVLAGSVEIVTSLIWKTE